MGSLLLAVIYLIFISLGLPDSLLGSGWPTMQVDFGVPSSYAGYVSMTISSTSRKWRTPAARAPSGQWKRSRSILCETGGSGAG